MKDRRHVGFETVVHEEPVVKLGHDSLHLAQRFDLRFIRHRSLLALIPDSFYTDMAVLQPKYLYHMDS